MNSRSLAPVCRRTLLSAGLVATRFSDAMPQQASPTRWNTITILADDLGEWAVGAYGNTEVPSPNIDRLAREGARFTNAFAASGVCTPSRVAFLTGLHPLQIGTLFDVQNIAGRATEGLPPGVPFWPRVLKQHGYATGLIGKWHLGWIPEAYPTNFGLDYFFGFLGGSLPTPMAPQLTRDRQTRVYRGRRPFHRAAPSGTVRAVAAFPRAPRSLGPGAQGRQRRSEGSRPHGPRDAGRPHHRDRRRLYPVPQG